MEDSEALISRIASGDRDAMRVFFERHEGPLFGFLKSRGADDQLAQDALQEAMLDVWRTASKFEGRSNAKTWLFTIARNKLIDQQRKSGKLSFVDEVPDTIDETPDAEAIMISAGDSDRVRKCLSNLKPEHLSVIRLAFYEDLNYAQIADIESVPEGTVKTRIFHAKKLLLRCLGKR